MSDQAFKLEGSWPCHLCGSEAAVRTVIYYESGKTRIDCISCFVKVADNAVLETLERGGQDDSDRVVQLGEILVVDGAASYVVYWPWTPEKLTRTSEDELQRIVETFYKIQVAAIKDE
jgi:hypothetical protein